MAVYWMAAGRPKRNPQSRGVFIMENEPMAPQVTVKLPNFWFCLIWPAVSLVLVVLVMGATVQKTYAVEGYRYTKQGYVTVLTDLTPLHPYVPIAALLVVLGCAHWLWCVYRVHQVMAEGMDHYHPVSPAEAVEFHLIPAYNLFWVLKWPREIAKSVNKFSKSCWMGESASGVILFLALLSQYTICFDIVQLWRSSSGFSRNAPSLEGLVTMSVMVRTVWLALAIMAGAKISRCVRSMLSDPNPSEWPARRKPC
jgi:hypothetical protein